jgi:hypothetical protein
MKVGNVTERSDSAQGPSILDSDELDRTGIDLGATGRLQLMFKLAEGEFCIDVETFINACLRVWCCIGSKFVNNIIFVRSISSHSLLDKILSNINLKGSKLD